MVKFFVGRRPDQATGLGLMARFSNQDLFLIDRKNFGHLMKVPEFRFLIASEASGELRQAYEIRSEMGRGVRLEVISVLVYEMERLNEENQDVKYVLNLTRSEIWERIGRMRDKVTKELIQLRRENIISTPTGKSGIIEITDPMKLKDLYAGIDTDQEASTEVKKKGND